jgi:hydrogenase expression/formation protein HypD
VDLLETGRPEVAIQYGRAVKPEGNLAARAILDEVFEIADRPWRGIGVVPGGGLALRDAYREFDAEYAFPHLAVRPRVAEPAACRAGDVLRGALRPPECPAFGRACTPEHPLGAPMVSTEGACAAYYRWRDAEACA